MVRCTKHLWLGSAGVISRCHMLIKGFQASVKETSAAWYHQGPGSGAHLSPAPAFAVQRQADARPALAVPSWLQLLLLSLVGIAACVGARALLRKRGCCGPVRSLEQQKCRGIPRVRREERAPWRDWVSQLSSEPKCRRVPANVWSVRLPSGFVGLCSRELWEVTGSILALSPLGLFFVNWAPAYLAILCVGPLCLALAMLLGAGPKRTQDSNRSECQKAMECQRNPEGVLARAQSGTQETTRALTCGPQEEALAYVSAPPRAL